MNPLSHSSAKSSHYNESAEHYDAFNEQSSEQTNDLIDKTLKQHKVNTVLDLTCGTGSQVFWLTKCGYEVIGSDINLKMLEVARQKAKKENLDIKFLEGNMCSIKIGKFDAVITIFNAVGHLTKIDFETAMRNIHANLNENGLYVFDIFNLNYLLKDDNITKLTIDLQEKYDNKTARRIQYSTIDTEGILASYEIDHEQEGSNKPKISTQFQTLQVYSANQLKEMLQKNGFKVVHQCDINGSELIKNKTERMLTIAQKQ